VVEVNSETDFVARNTQFQDMVRAIARTALGSGGSVEKLAAMPLANGGKSVADTITNAIATIGENMGLRRVSVVSVPQGVVASYIHNAAGEGLGKIGVLVGVESAGKAEALLAIGKQVAMHVAAASPLAVRPEEVAADVVARERAIFAEQAKESGKPANIIDKMVDGRMRKFYEESVLLTQAFVINPDLTVEKAVKAAEAAAGAPIRIAGFVRMALGEGIDKGGAEG
jgi:elongation factor Ts